MLVLLVLLGQHAMELLSKDKIKEVTKSEGTVLLPSGSIPDAKDFRTLSLPAQS
jgi:hypothetical protein